MHVLHFSSRFRWCNEHVSVAHTPCHVGLHLSVFKLIFATKTDKNVALKILYAYKHTL